VRAFRGSSSAVFLPLWFRGHPTSAGCYPCCACRLVPLPCCGLLYTCVAHPSVVLDGSIPSFSALLSVILHFLTVRSNMVLCSSLWWDMNIRCNYMVSPTFRAFLFALYC